RGVPGGEESHPRHVERPSSDPLIKRPRDRWRRVGQISPRAAAFLSGHGISAGRAARECSERQGVKPLQERPTVLELAELRLRPGALQRRDFALGVLTRCRGALGLYGATIAIQARIRFVLLKHDQVLAWLWS